MGWVAVYGFQQGGLYLFLFLKTLIKSLIQLRKQLFIESSLFHFWNALAHFLISLTTVDTSLLLGLGRRLGLVGERLKMVPCPVYWSPDPSLVSCFMLAAKINHWMGSSKLQPNSLRIKWLLLAITLLYCLEMNGKIHVRPGPSSSEQPACEWACCLQRIWVGAFPILFTFVVLKFSSHPV